MKKVYGKLSKVRALIKLNLLLKRSRLRLQMRLRQGKRLVAVAGLTCSSSFRYELTFTFIKLHHINI